MSPDGRAFTAASRLAEGAGHPERVLGLHYFYHPAKNRLVEVVPGRATAERFLRAAWSLQEQTGKTPIAAGDVFGFVVNRFFVPWLNEAVRLRDEQVAETLKNEGLDIARRTVTKYRKALQIPSSRQRREWE